MWQVRYLENKGMLEIEFGDVGPKMNVDAATLRRQCKSAVGHGTSVGVLLGTTPHVCSMYVAWHSDGYGAGFGCVACDRGV